MDYLYLPFQAMDSEAFVGAEPVDRATWLCLLRYCIGQENGGKILACSEWGDRKWQQVCRVTKAEVHRECDLWCWDDLDLVIEFYPAERVKMHQELSQRGKEAAANRWKRERGLAGGVEKSAGEPKADAKPMPQAQKNMRDASKPDGLQDAVGEVGINGVYGVLGGGRPAVGTTPLPKGLASSWADRNPNLMPAMVAQFERPNTTVKDVLEYWKVKWDLKGRPLNGEWNEKTEGQSPVEVFLVFANAPEGSIGLPSEYKKARRAFEMTESA